jgi:hypothetical protein
MKSTISISTYMKIELNPLLVKLRRYPQDNAMGILGPAMDNGPSDPARVCTRFFEFEQTMDPSPGRPESPGKTLTFDGGDFRY